MELAFLVKDSNEKECGICLEVIKDKVAEPGSHVHVDRRFGILENCIHCFCLSCIKEWRNKRCAEKQTHRYGELQFNLDIGWDGLFCVFHNFFSQLNTNQVLTYKNNYTSQKPLCEKYYQISCNII